MDSLLLSIVICTRNRAFILPECLDALLAQTILLDRVEVVIINNTSTDNTQEVIDGYKIKFPLFKSALEAKIGLSFARNLGIHEATGKWILFLDDDAKAAPNLLERIFSVISRYDFDAFGGRYLAWNKFGRPNWLPLQFGNMPNLLSEIGYLHQPNLAGGVMVIRKQVLVDLGGFSTQLGMKQEIGYGEDTEIQYRMLQQGLKLGYDPDMLIYHCIMPHKLKLWWHLHSVYAHGRDGQAIIQDKSLGEISYKCIRTFLTLFFVHLPFNLIKVLLKKDFYIQNAIIESCIPFMGWLGRLITIIRNVRIG